MVVEPTETPYFLLPIRPHSGLLAGKSTVVARPAYSTLVAVHRRNQFWVYQLLHDLHTGRMVLVGFVSTPRG